MLEQWLTILLVAVVLGVDAFSLSMGMGIRGVSDTYERRFSLLVGVFHIIMPLIGLNLGLVAGKFLGIWAGRLGAVILAYIGFDMLRKAYLETREKPVSFSKARMAAEPEAEGEEGTVSLLLLVTSVSMDALTIGFSLGTVQMPIFYTVCIMGIVAGAMTYAGFKGGRVFSRVVGSYAQFAGGIILLGLAVKMVF